MSKIEWEDPVLGKHVGTDGLGIVVTARQVIGGKTSSTDTPVLHVDLLVYLETPTADPRPAIEAAIKTLKEELGI